MEELKKENDVKKEENVKPIKKKMGKQTKAIIIISGVSIAIIAGLIIAICCIICNGDTFTSDTKKLNKQIKTLKSDVETLKNTNEKLTSQKSELEKENTELKEKINEQENKIKDAEEKNLPYIVNNTVDVSGTSKYVTLADYKGKNTVETFKDITEAVTYKAKDSLKAPYINLNSDDANKANAEIKENFEKYSEFFGKLENSNEPESSNKYYAKIEYAVYENNGILSVLYMLNVGLCNTDATWQDYYVYNINISTGKYATYEEICKSCGCSKNTVEDTLKIFEENMDAQGYGKDQNPTYKIQKDKFFIDQNKKLNFVYLVEGEGKYSYTITIK